MTSFVVGRNVREDHREKLFFFFVGSSGLVSLAESSSPGLRVECRSCAAERRRRRRYSPRAIDHQQRHQAEFNMLSRKGRCLNTNKVGWMHDF